MANTSSLLDLPQELRDEIWALVFKDINVSGPGNETFHNFTIECEPCFSFSVKERSDASSAILPYNLAFRPLLTCKQIYHEASSLFYDTMTVHLLTLPQFKRAIAISSSTAINTTISSSTWPFSSLSKPPPPPRHSLRDKIKNLTLYLHLDDETRYEWMPHLANLPNTFPHLDHLTIYNHMRPPTSYDRLVDALYLTGPLATLPTTISPITSTTSTSTSTSPTNTSANAQRITLTLHFAYIKEEVMFESPFLGDIRSSDAIEEHELVIRDVLADREFAVAAGMQDLNAMTVRLLGVAREHEQSWLEKLQRRRMQDHVGGNGDAEGGEEGDGGDEGGGNQGEGESEGEDGDNMEFSDESPPSVD